MIANSSAGGPGVYGGVTDSAPVIEPRARTVRRQPSAPTVVISDVEDVEMPLPNAKGKHGPVVAGADEEGGS